MLRLVSFGAVFGTSAVNSLPSSDPLHVVARSSSIISASLLLLFSKCPTCPSFSSAWTIMLLEDGTGIFDRVLESSLAELLALRGVVMHSFCDEAGVWLLLLLLVLGVHLVADSPFVDEGVLLLLLGMGMGVGVGEELPSCFSNASALGRLLSVGVGWGCGVSSSSDKRLLTLFLDIGVSFAVSALLFCDVGLLLLVLLGVGVLLPWALSFFSTSGVRLLVLGVFAFMSSFFSKADCFPLDLWGVVTTFGGEASWFSAWSSWRLFSDRAVAVSPDMFPNLMQSLDWSWSSLVVHALPQLLPWPAEEQGD